MVWHFLRVDSIFAVSQADKYREEKMHCVLIFVSGCFTTWCINQILITHKPLLVRMPSFRRPEYLDHHNQEEKRSSSSDLMMYSSRCVFTLRHEITHFAGSEAVPNPAYPSETQVVQAQPLVQPPPGTSSC